MVMIESVRIIIRPLTLAVRLAANIIAGHLLLSLIGGQAYNTGDPCWLHGLWKGSYGPHGQEILYMSVSAADCPNLPDGDGTRAIF